MAPMAKRYLFRVGPALAVLVLSSCATVPPAPPPAPGGFAGGSDGSDLVARSTGFRFPARVGLFVRGDNQQYDEPGQDLSVTYRAGVLIVATVYDYPTGGKTLDMEFMDRKDEIKSVHKDARLLRDEQVTIHPGRKSRRGRKAVFVLQPGFAYHSEQPYQSDLLIFQRKDRFVAYRFSYPATHRERAEIEITKFIDALAWPEISSPAIR
jgi:hypothetical protein